jgi:two-component system, NarL family, nitrate/nitrite response regulator NarL
LQTTSFCAPLSDREKEVLGLLVQGKSAREMAETLGISYVTVRNHLQTILRKFGVHTQRQVIKLAVEHHLV